MARKPNAETEKKAFLICLIGQLNDALHQSSYSIEAMLGLIEKTKSVEEFEKTLTQLSQFSKHQSMLAVSISNHIESLKKSEEAETSPTTPQVH